MPSDSPPLPSPSPNTAGAATPDVVHPNSHASMVLDPKSTVTGPATLKGLSAGDGKLIKLLSDTLSPATPDLEGNILRQVSVSELQRKSSNFADSIVFFCVGRLLHTFIVAWQSPITEEEGERLCEILNGRYGQGYLSGGESGGIGVEELEAIRDICSRRGISQRAVPR